MTKKLKKAAKSGGKQLSDGVHASAQQIWQAGLEAFAKTQQEGGKVISKLAKEGSSLQKRSRKIAEDKVTDVSDRFIMLTNSVGKQASDSWGRLEHLVEQAVTRSLTSLGLSTQKELLALHKRIDDLGKPATTKQVKKPAAKKVAAKKAPVRKTAAKRVATKAAPKTKTVAKKTVTRTAAKSTRAAK